MSSIMYLSLYKIDIDVSSSHIPSYFQIQGACRACDSKIGNFFCCAWSVLYPDQTPLLYILCGTPR